MSHFELDAARGSGGAAGVRALLEQRLGPALLRSLQGEDACAAPGEEGGRPAEASPETAREGGSQQEAAEPPPPPPREVLVARAERLGAAGVRAALGSGAGAGGGAGAVLRAALVNRARASARGGGGGSLAQSAVQAAHKGGEKGGVVEKKEEERASLENSAN